MKSSDIGHNYRPLIEDEKSLDSDATSTAIHNKEN
jgi:hypothetical protein